MIERRLGAVATAVLTCCLFAAPSFAGGPPFHADLAGGRTMPLPWGVGLTYYDQSQDYALDSLTLGVPGFENVPVDLLEIDNDITSYTVKFDVWLLPFLNVFGLVGEIDGGTNVDFRPLHLPLPLEQVTIDYDGDVYGGGLTLAAGGDVWFTSLTGVYTESNLSGDFDSDARSFVAMPRLGIHNARGSVWVGAMYLDTEENHKGTIDLPFLGSIPFEVDLVQNEDWNAIVGIQGTFGTHWTVEVEGGFGSRDSLSATAGFRF